MAAAYCAVRAGSTDLYQQQVQGENQKAAGLQPQHVKHSAPGCLMAAMGGVWVQCTIPTYQAAGVGQVELDPPAQRAARKWVLQLWLAVLASPEAQSSGLYLEVSAVHGLVLRADPDHG